MNSQMIVWIVTVGCIALAFLFRCIEKMRNEISGHHAPIEWKDSNTIYEYDIDDDLEEL